MCLSDGGVRELFVALKSQDGRYKASFRNEQSHKIEQLCRAWWRRKVSFEYTHVCPRSTHTHLKDCKAERQSDKTYKLGIHPHYLSLHYHANLSIGQLSHTNPTPPTLSITATAANNFHKLWRRRYVSICMLYNGTISTISTSRLFSCTRATIKPSWFWSVVNVAFIINSLTTVGYLLGVVFRLWIPFLVRIPLLLGASTGNLS